MVANGDLKEYYAQRAREYEKVYLKPERRGDLVALRAALEEALVGHDVLEVACGTGYWTEPLSLVARSMLATDVNPEVMELARQKSYPKNNVRFQLADAFTMEGVEGEFTAGFAGFWWSHVEKSKLRPFLRGIHAWLGPGRLVVFADNNYVEGSMHAITRRDAEGNSYQTRRLEDGREYEVLKNFPDEDELRRHLNGMAEDVKLVSLTYYWLLSYRIATP
jgi:demethylmenaquinone methyltransferase/2-methoxy-6-polyprenyl-1,4-benzoquinol methylase